MWTVEGRDSIAFSALLSGSPSSAARRSLPRSRSPRLMVRFHRRADESNYVAPLLDAARDRGFTAETTSLDMGYDNERVYGECEDRDSRPIIPLRETPPSRPGRRGRRPANMASGGSLVPTRGTRGPSGGVPPGSVRLLPDGVKADRLHPFTPWSRASRSDGSRSTEAVRPSSASSGG